MKSTNKRLVSILLCLAMVLAVLPMAVSAETATTIYVQPNDNWKTDGAWFAAYFYNDSDNTWVACTDAGDGLYSVDVPAGYSKVIFCRMNPADTTTLDWSNRWNQTADLDIPTDNKVVYVVDGWDKGAGQWIEIGGEVEEVEVVYYLRGDMNNWDTSMPMTNNGDGTWSITITLAAGTYQYKAADAGWGTSIPAGDNASVTVAAEGDVTFVADVNAGTISATADSVVEPDPVEYTYYVAGSEELCGVAWDPANEDNKMVYNEETGLYEIVLDVWYEGTYEYKITTGTWNPSYGPAEGGNYTVVVKNPGEVTITFNAETTEVTCDVYEFGEAEVKYQLNADASADDATVDLRLISWVDSLDYQDVTFVVTIEGQTVELSITTVYEAINANGATYSTSDLFGQEGYVVTYTIEGLIADYYGSEISVTVCRTDLEGNAVETETRTIVVSDAL